MIDLGSLLASAGPALVAAGGVVAGVVAVIKNARRLRSLFSSSESGTLAVELRELADTRLEIVKELKEQLDEVRGQLADEKDAHDKTRRSLDFSQRSLDDCDRQRQGLYERLYRCEHPEERP